MKHRKRKPCCIIPRGSVKVPVYKRTQRKGKKRYTYYQVPNHNHGEQKRHMEHCATLAEAKAKATEIAEATAQGDPQLLSYSALKRPLQNALEALEATGLRIDHACRLIADACQIIAPDKFLEACRLYKQLEPDKPFTPTRVRIVCPLALSTGCRGSQARERSRGKAARSTHPAGSSVEKGRAIMGRLRNSLALAALTEIRPDLIIFDEFQKFRELLIDEPGTLADPVTRALRGKWRVEDPALLLLSATPYRL
jgi:hypothetical protein